MKWMQPINLSDLKQVYGQLCMWNSSRGRSRQWQQNNPSD